MRALSRDLHRAEGEAASHVDTQGRGAVWGTASAEARSWECPGCLGAVARPVWPEWGERREAWQDQMCVLK